jgi:hypothetical protein
MATLKQIDANRRNAQKSTGPKTQAGRAAVRFNGLTHGLTAETLVVAGESLTDFESLLASLEAEHDPATPTEVALVFQLTMATWRLRRGFHAEASYLTRRVIDTKDNADRDDTNLDASDHIAIAIDRSAQTLNNFSRYESRLERSFYRALNELQRLRKQRLAEMENQSQFPDPDPPEPVLIALPEEAPKAPQPIAQNPTGVWPAQPTTYHPQPAATVFEAQSSDELLR